ncbi:Capsular polysaccharide synthesis enzyme [Leifsonia rubra CMS 76R]|nr:Capsular polysaccharide synthesis enzyme [Leifsonia rubra CMS 76R]
MTKRRILLISYSDLKSDPRLRRQIDWLAGDGWSIDTLGLGQQPASAVDAHHALLLQAPWVRSRAGSFFVYGVLTSRAKFQFLMLDRIPQELLTKIASGVYDCIVFEDYDFLPLLTRRKIFTRAALNKQIHLDMHEYRDPRLKINSIRRRLTDRYYRWRRSLIGHPAISTRTTVASRIAQLYADEFGVKEPIVVRNSPPAEALSPSPVMEDNIKLAFHGMASWARGFREIFAALPEIDERFTMTFMLTGNQSLIREVKKLAEPLGERVEFVSPVSVNDVASRINEFDLELIFLPPKTVNLEYALPNKLFEAIQGRLGVVIGQSPMMKQIVDEFGVGVVVSGWTPSDLATTISGLTAERVRELKDAAHRAADILNAEAEGSIFLSAIAEYRNENEGSAGPTG